ncbi:VWA domain-containing protein [Methylobacterium organophilum]|uniref:vWA domain-containing protein n=1 Tax=Methylobacterium organophilum TaxID=410 RepID=UPI001F13CB06|nr:VWA domain-containing protein [Methylobacterium organophilum]UMY16888.1 VWA domain-containing protein [Methylobacterium organophilum]
MTRPGSLLRDLPLARNLRDRRLQALGAALLLTLLAAFVPPLPLTRSGVAVLAVVDITGSMNVRDYTEGGKPVSRLDTAKAALRRLVADLPCGSRLALGLFTERRPFLLFTPIEVCADFAPLDGALAALDWRMAWEGDSRVAAGLHRAVAMAGELGTDLLFVSDGQETPPPPSTDLPPFEGKPGAVRGLIVGAGGYALSPIPKYNDRGRETGFYAETDVQQENRFGPPPADAESREGYNPRNAPFGAAAARGTEHLSSVREAHLKALAAQTGLAYAHLDGPGGLAAPLAAAATPRPLPGRLDLRPFLGTAALALVLATFLAGPLRALRPASPLTASRM